MPYAHQTASSGLALDHRGSQAVFDRQRRKIRITDQTAGHSAVDPNVCFCFSAQLALGAAQVHLTAVDRCLAVQLSHQTANISIAFRSGAKGLFSCDLGAGQTDVFQFTGKGLEQSRVTGHVDRQVIDHRVIASDLTVIALDLRIYKRNKVPGRIENTPTIAFIALELDIPLLHCGGDDLL